MIKEIIAIIAVIILILFRAFVIEPNSLEVTKYDIEDASLSGLRVAFLSDLHLKKNDYKRLDKIVNRTNMELPHIVLFGGDFVYSKNPKKAMNYDIMAQKLSLLKSSHRYAVLGETDWRSEPVKIIQALKNNKITVLENANKQVMFRNTPISIIGLSDYTVRRSKIATSLRRTIRPRIMVTHNPDIYLDILDDVNMIFAGHTHGGQFVLPLTKPIFTNSKYGSEFASGIIKKTKNNMVVSKGLGTTGMFRVRLNCKPEIVIVDFVKPGSIKPAVKTKKRL